MQNSPLMQGNPFKLAVVLAAGATMLVFGSVVAAANPEPHPAGHPTDHPTSHPTTHPGEHPTPAPSEHPKPHV